MRSQGSTSPERKRYMRLPSCRERSRPQGGQMYATTRANTTTKDPRVQNSTPDH